MICPHCQTGLPENYRAVRCPICGTDLPGEQRPPGEMVLWKFFAILVAPAAISFCALVLGIESLAMLSGLFGGLISGAMCARMLLEKIDVTGAKKGLIGLLLFIIMACLSYFIALIGCASSSLLTRHGI